MCGIVGATLREGSVVEGILEGLRVLEYRGYDSSGLGVVREGRVEVEKREGRLEALRSALEDGSLAGGAPVGVGHTRWATHGEPSDRNAHPHTDAAGRIALVHNGIIENHLEVKAELAAEGVVLRSDTDTEVLAHLVGRGLDQGLDPLEALRAALARVRGYYAVAVAVADANGPRLLCARHGPPLVVALSDGGAWLASDVLALLPHSSEVRYLEDGDAADLSPDRIEVRDASGAPVERPVHVIEWDAEQADRGGFPHYMLKEIHEQPDVIARTIAGRLDLARGDVLLEGEAFEDERLRAVSRVQAVACGTALHACHVAKFLIEGLAGVPVDLDYASEFRYRTPCLVPDTMALSISQSGETADTLAAVRLARALGAWHATICNVVGSSTVREAEGSILTQAGPEIGVASTKAFVAQITAAYLLAVRMGRARGVLDEARGRLLLEELRSLRPLVERMLRDDELEAILRMARENMGAKGFLFLGRGINYPIALEGALKLKEISYVHAEGYPAGEMKHGPIALIEPGMTTVVVNAAGPVADKVRANIEQVKARSGKVISFGSDPESLDVADDGLLLPATSEWLSPIVNVIPLQLFSYYIAEGRGCDIDKPRNLAKSVTVE
jgi:glucosamine--fructose-6-phosphate aminotransferase (isomerizing)